MEVEGGFWSTTCHATHERPAATGGSNGVDVRDGRGIVGNGDRKVGRTICEGGSGCSLEGLVLLVVENGGALCYLEKT